MKLVPALLPRALVAALMALLSSPITAHAGPNVNARILVHLASPVAKSPCLAPASILDCGDIRTAGDLYPQSWYAYVLATDGAACAGIAGLQFGVTYDGRPGQGVDVYSWTSCAETSLTGFNWPAAGSGIGVGWDAGTSCRRMEPGGAGTGVIAAAGYFYLSAYSPDNLAITPHPGDDRARILDCTGVNQTIVGSGPPPSPFPLGTAAFSAGGTSPGYNPCGTAPPSMDCLITGPDAIPLGYSARFVVDAPACDELIHWDIEGSGTILGSTIGDSVFVRGDAVGSIGVRAAGVVTGVPFACERTVTILSPPAGCSIGGPSSVSAGQIVTYSTADVVGATYVWTIGGAGQIDGPADARQVTVHAGQSGVFQLDVAVTTDNETVRCNRSISIQPNSGCLICCADEVFGGPTVTPFLAGSDTMATFAWSITGNGSILGSTTRWRADVQAGPAAAGPFTLSAVVTKPGSIRTCNQTVAVIDPPPPPPNGNREAKIMLHLVPPSPVGCDLAGCWTFASRIPCTSAVTKGALYPKLYYAGLLVARGETDGTPQSGIGGAQFGLDYRGGATGDGLDIYGWILLATFEFASPGWPGPGTGIRIVPLNTDHCFNREPAGIGTGVSAQLGYFYLAAYSPDTLAVTTYPGDDLARVIDCAGRETVILGAGASPATYPLGSAAFTATGATEGYNPCDPAVAVVPTTWSRIKSLISTDR